MICREKGRIGRRLVMIVLVLLGLSARVEANDRPDLLSLGVGVADVFSSPTPSLDSGGDFRLEYRSGFSLLPPLGFSLGSFDEVLALRPAAGIEMTKAEDLYGFVGVNLDFLFAQHVVFSPQMAVGAYRQGADGKDLGAILEFRSMLEVGWRFERDIRLVGFFSHTSNANIVATNPGVETVGLALQIPFGH